MCLLVLLYMVTPIMQQPSLLNLPQKLFQTIYNTYVFAGITIYGYSNHTTAITIKKHFQTYYTV